MREQPPARYCVREELLRRYSGPILIPYFRKGIATCFRQLTARFPRQTHAVTAAGFALQIARFLFARVLNRGGLEAAAWICYYLGPGGADFG